MYKISTDPLLEPLEGLFLLCFSFCRLISVFIRNLSLKTNQTNEKNKQKNKIEKRCALHFESRNKIWKRGERHVQTNIRLL